MKQILVALTKDELEHLVQLIGKDIGWNQKHGNPEKSEMARTIYLKLAKINKEHGR